MKHAERTGLKWLFPFFIALALFRPLIGAAQDTNDFSWLELIPPGYWLDSWGFDETNLQTWQLRIQQMKACKSIAELVRQHGEPPHKVPQDGFEIWHYPLGVADGTLYSIHVSVWPDQKRQIYMHMEPTSAPDTPAERLQFSQSANQGVKNAFRFLGRILGR